MDKKRKPTQGLVKMSMEAGRQHKTYGELQKEETLQKLQEETRFINANEKLELARYRKVGSVQEFRDLKKKNTPIEVEVYPTGEGFTMTCPVCDHIYASEELDGLNHCINCGQAIKPEVEE